MVVYPIAQLVIHHPASPTLSLELITSSNEVVKTCGRDKAVLGTFWDSADATVSKAHDAITVEDLKPLATRTSQELRPSHVQKNYTSRFYLFARNFFFFFGTFFYLFLGVW